GGTMHRGVFLGHNWAETAGSGIRESMTPDPLIGPRRSSEAFATTCQRVGIILEDSDRSEPRQELVQAGESIGGPLLNHLQDQIVVFRSDLLVMSGQRERPFAQVLLEQLLRGIGPKWRSATC